MLSYIKRKAEKKRLKRTFKEYGYDIHKYTLKEIGEVEYAQWLHPFETLKALTNENVDFYKSLAPEGSMIIDIGAHTGDTTVPMALAVGKKGLVLGLEPNIYVYKILEKNAQLNKDKTNLVPLSFAATTDDGEFEFHYSDASFCNGGFLSNIKRKRHGHNFTLNVTGKNFQKYLFENHKNDLEKLSLLKVDAEGYDKEILKTLPEILKTYKPAILAECYKRLNGEERDDLFNVISSHGYNLYYLENFENSGEKLKINREDMTRKKHFEMLAIHGSKE